MPSTIFAEGLIRYFGAGIKAVDGIDLAIDEGQIFGFLGANGSGKTTTVRMLTTLLRPTAGRAQVCGLDVLRQPAAVRRSIGVALQEAGLDDVQTGRELLRLQARLYRLPASDVEPRVAQLLDIVDLADAADRRIKTYSGGMRRRLDLAAALVHRPKVVFLDEPTTGLDPQARHLMWERLRVLLRQGKTILLTTHFMDEAERLCDRLKIIDHGRTLADGAPRALIAGHVEPEVVEVYGEGVGEWLRAHGAALAARAELHGETAFCYVRDPGPVIASLRGMPGLRFLHRPANLEDLFLKLTGREIRDE